MNGLVVHVISEESLLIYKFGILDWYIGSIALIILPRVILVVSLIFGFYHYFHLLSLLLIILIIIIYIFILYLVLLLLLAQ